MKRSGRTLLSELAKCAGKTVCIGSRSSFFFIGPAEEAMEDMPILGAIARFCVALLAHKHVKLPKNLAMGGMGGRKVLKKYYRDTAEGKEAVIIVEGSEMGAFWTRGEYLAGKKLLLKAASKEGQAK